MDWSHVCGIGNREGNNGSNLWDCLKYTWLHGLVDGEGRFVGLTPGCMDWSHVQNGQGLMYGWVLSSYALISFFLISFFFFKSVATTKDSISSYFFVS